MTDAEPARDQLVSRRQAAVLAGVDVRTIDRWHRTGLLSKYRAPMSRRVWYLKQEITDVREIQQEIVGPIPPGE